MAVRQGTVDATADELVRVISVHGEPFLADARDLAGLERLVQEHESDDRRLVRIPIIRALRADADGALAALDAVRRQVGADHVDRWHARAGAARERERFLAGFERWLDAAAR